MTVSINGTNGLVFNDGSSQATAATGFGFKNRIINGAMVIDQRNAGAAVTVNSTTATYTVDRFIGRGESADGVFTVDQVTDAPAGFTNSAKITVTTADASVGASQLYIFGQVLEGFNVADLGFGTANAQTVTVSFWVRSSLTGTFGGVLKNDGTFSYPFNYTINAANTWEQKSITIIGQTSGTWDKTNSAGMRLFWSLGAGSTFTTTANAWASGNYFKPTGATDVIGTSGATFYITGVQLEKGSTATSFDYRPYGTELALCQRYYYRIRGSDTASNTTIFGYGFSQSTTTGRAVINFPVTMRSIPSALEQSGTANHYRVVLGSSGSTDCSAVPTYTSASVLMADISWTVASGATANQGILFMSNNASSYLGWSAEL
jgi:hypothetical protein